MPIDTEKLKELRELTGAGMMECKRALDRANGDRDRALEFLKEWGYQKSAKLVGRMARVGRVGCYIHNTASAKGRIGVMVELTCETDFVARHEEFEELLHDLCLQIAGGNPSVISREDLPAAVVEAERRRIESENQGKPPEIVERIVQGKLEKLYARECLMDQPFLNELKFKGTTGELVRLKSAKFGENIAVRRFVRMEVNMSTVICDKARQA